MNRRSLLGVMALSSMAGCAGSSEDIGGPALDTAAFFAAIKPGDLGRSVEALQLVSVRRGNDALFFEIRISVTPQRLMLVALDSLGQRLMTMAWANDGVTSQKLPQLPAVVSPERLLMDLVVILWPQRLVEQALARVNATLVAQGRNRTVAVRGRDVLRAQLGWEQGAAWTGALSYLNVSRGYTVDVRSTEAG